jgi:transposase-like protein
MGIQNAGKKWTQPIPNWGLILSQLSIFFEDRLEKALKL